MNLSDRISHIGLIVLSVSGATNAVTNTRYITNTSASGFTLTLPPSPLVGDYIEVVDGSGTWITNNLTISRNGKNINGMTMDLTCNVTGIFIKLHYTGVTTGWQVDISASSMTAPAHSISNHTTGPLTATTSTFNGVATINVGASITGVNVVGTSSGDAIGLTPLTTGNGGILAATNNAGSAYAPLLLKGSTISLGTTTGGTVASVSSTGLAVTGTLTTTADSGSYNTLTINDSATYAAGVGGNIIFGGNIGSGIAGLSIVQGIKENATSGNYASALLFKTRANGAAIIEQARFTSSGNLLIGTTTDNASGAKLQVNGNMTVGQINSSGQLNQSTAVSGGFAAQLQNTSISSTAGGLRVIVPATSGFPALQVDSAGATSFLVDSAGNVTIGIGGLVFRGDNSMTIPNCGIKFQRYDDTHITVYMRGNDGVLRAGSITVS